MVVLASSSISISQPPAGQCVRAQPERALKASSRREFGARLLLVSMALNPSFRNLAVASELDSNQVNPTPRRDDPGSWEEYVGDGFAMKIPPGFEDTAEPDEYAVGEAPLYGYKPKAKVFSARFASADQEEFVSVIIRRTSQLKPTFFEATSITDLGKVEDIAKLFLPVGARLTGTSSVTENNRVYYLYEYLVGIKHVFLSAAAKSGKVFVAAVTAPQAKWEDDGAMLRSSAASFSLL